MQKIFTKYICLVVSFALAAILVYNYYQQNRNAQAHLAENSGIKLEQITEILQENEADLAKLTEDLREDYLARANSFAYIIAQNPEVLKSQSELNRIKGLLNVDELHVINRDGFLIAGTIPKYFGMDFRSTKQTSEFLRILEDPRETLVQEPQPNGAEKKMFQYVGVARKDEPGIVQVGLSPNRLLEARRKNELSYIFSRVPVDPGSSLFAIEMDTGKILYHTDSSLVDRNSREMGFDLDKVQRFVNGGFSSFQGVKKFYTVRDYSGILFGYAQRESTLYSGRWEEMFYIFLYTFLTFLIVAVVINFLLKRQIVDGIHKIMADLRSITDGDLDTVVSVETNPEFRQLSYGINRMVQGIVAATGRTAKIINMVDMPIGVFEYERDSSTVRASDRFGIVMGWDIRTAEDMYRDKEKFVREMGRIMSACEKEEREVYKISEKPERWARIHMNEDENGTFGVAMDATDEMLEKRKIRYERDYDPLTGLRNHALFKKQVSGLLKTGKHLGVAAMMMLDLDCFKQINDRYGHDWGDKYLQIAAGFLKKLEGGDRITSRRSGDEFCVFFHGFSSREEIQGVVEDFYRWIEEYEIHFPGGTTGTLQISSGLAWYGGELCEFGELLKAADEALYDSKHHGRGKNSEYRENNAGDRGREEDKRQ